MTDPQELSKLFPPKPKEDCEFRKTTFGGILDLCQTTGVGCEDAMKNGTCPKLFCSSIEDVQDDGK